MLTQQDVVSICIIKILYRFPSHPAMWSKNECFSWPPSSEHDRFLWNHKKRSHKDDIINSSFLFSLLCSTYTFPLEIKHSCKIKLPGCFRWRSQCSDLECLSKSKPVFEAATITSQIKEIGFRVLPKVIENKKNVSFGVPCCIFILSLACAWCTQRCSSDGSEACAGRQRTQTEQALEMHLSEVCLTQHRCQSRTVDSPREERALVYSFSVPLSKLHILEKFPKPHHSLKEPSFLFTSRRHPPSCSHCLSSEWSLTVAQGCF